MGPELRDVQVCGNKLHVACSPVDDIIVSGRGVAYSRGHGHSQVEFEAELPDPAKSPNVRVTVVDALGRSAWTNPIWFI
jgi:hypothetical protein